MDEVTLLQNEINQLELLFNTLVAIVIGVAVLILALARLYYSSTYNKKEAELINIHTKELNKLQSSNLELKAENKEITNQLKEKNTYLSLMKAQIDIEKNDISLSSSNP